jgi:hypothetical protein
MLLALGPLLLRRVLDSRQNYTIPTTKNRYFCKLILGALRDISMHLFFQPSLLLYLAEYPISTDPCYDRSAMRICAWCAQWFVRPWMRARLEQHRLNSKDTSTSRYEAARKLLRVLRTRLRKEDKLSINGSGIMTDVIRAEQHGAELVAKRIQEAVQAIPVRLGVCGREAGVTIAYSTLTFALQTKRGSVTVSSPWVKEAMIAAQATKREGNLE